METKRTMIAGWPIVCATAVLLCTFLAIVTLTSATNASLSEFNAFTYTIVDDENPPAVAFATTTASGQETAAVPSIVVSLSTASGSNAMTTPGSR